MGHSRNAVWGYYFDSEYWSSFSSIGWKDIVSLKDPMGEGNWFTSEIVLKVENGERTRFGGIVGFKTPTCAFYSPRLFFLAFNKEAKVWDMRMREGDTWRWIWSWGRKIFVSEENLLWQLSTFVSTFVGREEVGKWSWKQMIVAFSRLIQLSKRNFQVRLKKSHSIDIAYYWKLLFGRVLARNNLRCYRVLTPTKSTCIVW